MRSRINTSDYFNKLNSDQEDNDENEESSTQTKF